MTIRRVNYIIRISMLKMIDISGGCMDAGGRKALYPIGIVAELIGISPRTLRAYEQEGLISPARRGGKRFYSNNELQWLKCVSKLLSEGGLNFPGIKKLLSRGGCWSIRNCSEEERKCCPAVLNIPLPCWDIKNRCNRPKNACSECEVYIGRTKSVREMIASGIIEEPLP
ncbi:MAG: MerR family transcriptional regulator [Syntrophobacteraceae bacterium]